MQNFLYALVRQTQINLSCPGRAVIKPSAQYLPTGSVLGPLEPTESFTKRMGTQILLQSDHGSPFLHEPSDSECCQGVVRPFAATEQKMGFVGFYIRVVFVEGFLDFLIDHEDIGLPRLAFLDGDAVAQLCIKQMLHTKLSEDRLNS